MGTISNPVTFELYSTHIPMLRHLAEPLDAGIFHGGVGVEALGDGVGDHRLPLLLEQLDQPLLLGNKPINPGSFIVEEGHYVGKFLALRQGKYCLLYILK